MNSPHNNIFPPEEIRVLVACEAGAMQAEREMLEDVVFPELRRLCIERGIVFTDIDFLRHAGYVSKERLLRSCIEEIHRNHPFIIGLLGEGGSEIAEGIVAAVGTPDAADIAGRAWFYTRNQVAVHGLPRMLRECGLRLREGWDDAAVLAEWVRDDLCALLAGIGPVERGRALERERGAHEAFAASRRIGTLARPAFAAATGGSSVAVTTSRTFGGRKAGSHSSNAPPAS